MSKEFNRWGSDELTIARQHEITRAGGTITLENMEADLRVFQNALHIIREYGWIKDSGGSYETGACVRGAMNAAVKEQNEGRLKWHHRYHPVVWKFIETKIYPYRVIPDWNDAPVRTEAEVIKFFEDVIDFIEEKLSINKPAKQYFAGTLLPASLIV